MIEKRTKLRNIKRVSWIIFSLCISCVSTWNDNTEYKYGKRLTGALITSMGIIGLQMCIKECITRKYDCLSVNFNRIKHECELNFETYEYCSSGKSLEDDINFVFIHVNEHSAGSNTGNTSSNCPTQTADIGRIWIDLASGSTIHFNDTLPLDCADLKSKGASSNGVYRISPSSNTFMAYCDMDTEGGGWTAFHRRYDGSVDFYRNWTEYKNGFGSVTGEYWLGNDNLHYLLSNGDNELRFDMADFEGNSNFLRYSSFNIGNESSGYMASVSGYQGGGGDCLTSGEQQISNLKFTTIDRDNDQDPSSNCAIRFKGAWWHRACHCMNPNGLYLKGKVSVFAEGMVFHNWLSHYYSLKTFSIMVRRKA